MGNMRVYELANELGMESKETLSRFRELGISVKSHMSVIEDADIQKLKNYLKESAQKSAPSKIEEKRIKPTVIRRRAVKSANAPEAVAEEPEKAKGKVAAKKKAKPKEKEKESAPARAQKKKVTKAAQKAAAAVEPEAGASAEEAPKARVYPLRAYTRPSLRRTARAVEDTSAPAPGKAAAEKAAEPEVKKKKKKGKAAAKAEEGEIQEGKKGKAAQAPAKKRSPRRKIAFKSQHGTVLDGMELIDMERMYLPARKKPVGKKRAPKKTVVTVPKQIKRQVRMGETVKVSELSKRMGVKAREIIKKLTSQDIEARAGTELDYETASLIAQEYNYEVIQEKFEEAKILAFPGVEDRDERLVSRPPVVTLMGHVDHGKTSLLDYIRKSRVAEQEAGGITQHIGASMIEMPQGKVTFLDTPGHEAFTAMRARGAKVTDIVVLVVAADDGVMPQTREAVNHSKAAEVPLIVAINKIDLPGISVEGIKQKLTEVGLLPEEYGGETQVVACSAKTGEGVGELLEAILLQAEMLELNADPDRPAEGVVIESRLDKGKGPICSVVVQQGTLKVGKPIICGNFSGKLRAMIDDKGQAAKEAGPSHPVEIVGLSGVPMPGDNLMMVEDDKRAKIVSEHRKEQHRQSSLSAPIKASLEDLLEMAKKGEKPKINLIVKADTNGSIEAVREVLNKIFGETVDLDIIHAGVGGITENDVLLASASGATVIGFMVRPETKAQKLAEKEKVELKLYQIIYDLGNDMEARLKGLFKPEPKERIIGHVEVREIFKIPRVGTVAGSYVTDGLVNRNARVRLLRDQVVIHEGRISSLKRFKDDAREVASGFECGLALENYQDIKPGDVIEAFVMEVVQDE